LNNQLQQSDPAAYERIRGNLMQLEQFMSPEMRRALEISFVHYPEAVWLLGERLQDGLEVAGCRGPTFLEKLQDIQGTTPEQFVQAAAQTHQEILREKYVQGRILADRMQHGRRITQAPPVFRAPRGGAGQPKDMASLAKREDASAYIRARMAQEEKAER
jgi:hypothetical protein